MSFVRIRRRFALSTGLSLVFGLGTCILLNLPSAKFIVLSPMLNVAVVGVLAICTFGRLILLRQPLVVGAAQKVFVLAFIGLVGLLLLSGIFGPRAVPDSKEVGRVMGLLVTVPLIILTIRPLDIRVMLVGQACWSMGIALWHMIQGFAVRGDIGLHYLNLGIGIAGGMVAAGGFVVFARTSMYRVVSIFVLLICFAGLLSLYGRAPILFSTLIIVTFALASRLTRGAVASRVFGFVAAAIVVCISLVNGVRYLSENWYGWARIERAIYSTDQEPRVELMTRSVELLLDRPVLGSGLNAAETVLGFYPHNIFLDVAISAGIPALLCLLAVLAVYARVAVAALNGPLEVAVPTMIAMYYFLTWNVSFTIGNSYVLFGAMAVAVASYEHARSNRVDENLGATSDSSNAYSRVPQVVADGMN